jgi:hypothetical protein
MVAVVGGTGCPKRRRLFKFASVQGDYLCGEKSSAKKLNAKNNYLSRAGVGARRSVGAGPATYQIRPLPPAAEQAPKKLCFLHCFPKTFPKSPQPIKSKKKSTRESNRRLSVYSPTAPST